VTGEVAIVAVLVLFYLSDCVVVSGSEARFLTGWRRGWWRRRGSIDINLSGPRRIAFAGVLPPLNPCIAADSGTLDVAAVRQSIGALQRHALPLLVLNNILFFSILVALPGVLLIERYAAYLTIAIIVSVLLWAATAACFLWTRRKTLGPSRFTQRVFTTLASPMALMRSIDVIAQQLFQPFHALALATVLCPREEVAAVARQYYFPQRPEERVPSEIEAFIRKHGLKGLVTAPPPRESGSESYCPRCWTQYGAGADVCADCEGRPLTAFTL
jgi:hypothetical protein